MAQITVAVFQVNELKTTVPSTLGCHHKVIDQLANLAVRHDDDVFLWAKAPIEQRVLVQHPGLHAAFKVGLAKTPRVGQLQANHQVFVAAHAFAVGLYQALSQLRDTQLCLRVHDQLLGVGATIVTNRDRFATPDHLGARTAKQRPAAARVVRRAAICQSVPAFHGVNGVAVAEFEPRNRHGLRHGGCVARFQRFIARHVQTQPIQVLLEALGAGQGFDLDEISKFHVRDSRGFVKIIITIWAHVARAGLPVQPHGTHLMAVPGSAACCILDAFLRETVFGCACQFLISGLCLTSGGGSGQGCCSVFFAFLDEAVFGCARQFFLGSLRIASGCKRRGTQSQEGNRQQSS